MHAAKVKMPEFKHPRPKIVSFFMCQCPRCGQEKVFKHSPFKLTKFSETQDACSVCKLVYAPEPGFFFGAMYWSYAILVALIVNLSILTWFMGWFEQTVFIIPTVIIILLPFIFRYSRMLMLYVVYPVMFKGRFYQNKVN
jgi:uncharacterized protein (DUF983 family)